MSIPYKWIGLGLLALAICTTAYFGWQEYNSAIEKAVELQEQLDEANDALQHTGDVFDTLDSNEQQTVRITERVETIRREVDALPETTDCVRSPAISHVLSRLSDDEQPTED